MHKSSLYIRVALSGAVVLLATFSLIVSAQAQTPSSCPSRPGVYALKDSSWIDLPSARAGKEKLRTGFPYHGVTIAVYSGASSSLLLNNDVSFCASGIPVGTTFLLGLSKDKKKNREVKVGTYSPFTGTVNFNIDKKQTVAMVQTRDANGTFILKSDNLAPGQYVLFMQQGTSLSSIPPAFDFYIR